jgi:hypothetical protein
MFLKYILLLFLGTISFQQMASAQQPTGIRDSTTLYRGIESYSKRGNFTRFIYNLVFKPTATAPAKRKKYRKLILKPYSAFEGKIIRQISIVTLDPFGYSISDTMVTHQNFVSKIGNKLHIKSLPITIRNLLLIRKNQPFDSLLVKESERLVRSRDYLRDVSFYVKPAAINADSVDIFIRALDIWSIIPDGSASISGITVNLTDRNFLGLGHSFQNIYTGDYVKGVSSYITNYSIPNIRNSYIGANLHFDILGQDNFNKGFAIDRPFFSPFARWAAGIYFTQQFNLDSVRTLNRLFVPQRYKLNVQDYWCGNAIRLFKGNSEYVRTTNLISAIRYLHINYLEKPSELTDTLQRYSNEHFFLAAIGIASRKYVQDKYIYKFGITEDVPIGKAFSLTGGYQHKNNGRLYLGGRISIGDYNSWGYLASNIEYGTFFNGGDPQQGVLSAGIIYFTGLLEIGKWKFRQFVKPQITIGFNRFSYDSLTINEGYGLDGFNSSGLSGTRRILFSLQTQAYTPWNFVGFRFGPFITCTMGMLGNSSSGFNHSKLYAQVGLGVLIKNENLVLNAFQVSIAFYPSIPGKGENVFKTNSFQTTDFGFRDFEIGKPGIILFR